MTTTIKYSPSINILRDNNYEFNYIVTPNADHVFNQIFTDVLKGIKSSTVIGAYGIGKSSFLLAMQQTLSGTHRHFTNYNDLIKQLPKYDFISIVGEFASFTKVLSSHFPILSSVFSSNDLLKSIINKYKQLQKNGKGLAIVVDEFGKFLEYAVKNNPESELYFIQQLAEFVNDSNNNTLFITTLHQDFNTYSVGLNNSQKQEWDKVRGRLKDIMFNEPVEQLLYLASERISQKNVAKQKSDKNFHKLFNCIKSSKAFPLKDYLQKDIAEKLFPIDILSAAALTMALQKYGQNERSLFSFLESNDYMGINDAVAYNTYYSMPQVYNYLMNNFYSAVTATRYNNFYSQWGAIKKSLERIEGVVKESSINDAGNIVKTIGLLNIFSSASGRLDLTFYTNYARLALGIIQPDEIIHELEKHKIIRYTGYNFRYILQEGTDLDIDVAIDEAGRLVEKVTNVVAPLNLYFDFPFISAKSEFYIKGTPRFFRFKLSEDPILLVPEDEVDGFINLVFADDILAEQRVRQCSANCNEAILYCYYKNTAEIKNTLFEIQKVKKVIANNATDKTAINYLKAIETEHTRLLNHYVLDGLYTANGKVVWYFQGQVCQVNSRHSLNQLLSHICTRTYYSTPVFKSELINKTNVSSQMSNARKNLIHKLLYNLNEINIGFAVDKFPPEKSIYLSLLAATGIHKIIDGIGSLNVTEDGSFYHLWQAGIDYLETTKSKERPLQDFVDILSTRPFKLKHGFITFWLPIFLIAKNDEYALYNEESYIPDLNEDDLEILIRRPALYKIKAFDVAGIKLQLFNRYRLLLNQTEQEVPSNKIFIQTIKPFLSFYRDLNEYAKHTRRLSKKTLALRQVIAFAKDPEKAFFEDFPSALGFSLLELQEKPKLADKFIKQMQDSIKELRTCNDNLVDRVENYIVNEILGVNSSFPEYKDVFRNRFKNLKTHLLLPHQKTFLTRLLSDLDDRKAWLNSLAQSCIKKTLSSLNDDDESLLFEKLKDWIYELDNLCEISKIEVDEISEEVLKLEITSFMQGINKNLIRIPKTKNKELETKSLEIKRILGDNKKINVTILAKLLQELLKND